MFRSANYRLEAAKTMPRMAGSSDSVVSPVQHWKILWKKQFDEVRDIDWQHDTGRNLVEEHKRHIREQQVQANN
ncbi:hypothetical protein LSH36_2g10008 [Paralvinella palmiformis]|uniref:Uncharacterized protein n=1 Tax=Paralvinella palmiformis TaxID=53620 RepID=A0AAD9KFA9_9ANNE|nr:hypothetical protein LSH36_2g10008 [Paralvinella palmiformis]